MEATITKICTKCAKEKSLNEFNKGNGTYGFKYDCKQCQSIYNKETRERDRERKNEYKRSWRKKNREKENKALKIWRENNPEKAKAIRKRSKDKASMELKPHIIKDIICSSLRIVYRNTNLSNELIEAKRQNVFFKREIKKQKQLQTI